MGYGLDHLAYDEVVASGLLLARTSGPTTAIPLAEHAMFLLLSVEKQANAARPALEEASSGMRTPGSWPARPWP